MNKIICNLLVLLASFCVAVVFGQKPVNCDVKEIKKPQFKIAFMSVGKTLQLHIVIKPKYQTDENLILLAKYLNQKYCKEEVIRAAVFDNKEDARAFTVYQVKQIPDTLRVIYRLDRSSGQEYLERIKVIDNKQVGTPIIIPK